jgi:molecular chaperone Hsp33
MDGDASRGGTPRSGGSGEGPFRLGVAGELELRWAAVDVTAALEEARRRHDLSPVAATALGRAFAGAALLRALATRSCNRLTLTLAGDGPLGKVIADVDAGGNLRGLVGEPRLELPQREDGKLPVGDAVGRGILRIRRELADGSTNESQVAIVTGEVGLDLAHYLEQSEQTSSAVAVGVLLGPEGIRSAGGMIAEVIPGAGEGLLRELERNLERLGGFSRTLAEEGVDGIVERVLAGIPFEVRERSSVRFRCRCDRESLLPRLAGLPEEDLREIAGSDGTVAAQCAFCGTTYLFDPEELARARARATH